MQFSIDRYRLRVQIATEDCQIPLDEIARMQAALAPLGEAVKDFPGSDLWINCVYHPRSAVYHVEAKLKAPGRTLFSGGRDAYLDSAFQACIRKLVQKTEAYQKYPDRVAEKLAQRRAPLDREIVAPDDPDMGPIGDAVSAGDYRAFRNRLADYEDWLRRRVGRWVQRYPYVDERIGTEFDVNELVEEVYLNAFERYAVRPTEVPLNEWLDGLIDVSVRWLLKHPDEERENIHFAQTLRETSPP